MKKINIAIDGPSAAGKSSIAKILAERLGYVHLDTGAMYRCTAYKALQKGIDLSDEAALVRMLQETKIDLTPSGNVFLDGKEVSHAIRADEVSMAASKVASLAGVRRELVARQQKMAEAGGFIMDGRDIGTVVLPEAELKIFMTATPHARALRRLRQNQEEAISESDLATVEKEIEERDYQDTHRKSSPLKKAEDAIVLDTSDLTIQETADAILNLAEPFLKEEHA